MFIFLDFFISLKYDFHVDAERMIERENVKKYLHQCFKNYDFTACIFFSREYLPIFIDQY